jgi:hypothetical protein
MVKSNPSWEDDEEFEAHLAACATEAEENKADILWHTVIGQKALE